MLGRRELLQWVGVAGATTATGCGTEHPAAPQAAPAPSAAKTTTPPPPKPAYFSADDAGVLNALADAVLPPDDVPGGGTLGLVGYLEKLLTAFDATPPAIFAGGPFSGREAVPLPSGGPSKVFPSDEFSSFLPLDRVQTKAWKLRIFGSKGVTGGGPNDAITGPVIGLRDAVATAIQQAKAAMPPNVTTRQLTQDEKTSMLSGLDRVTLSTFIELVLEASFSAPEYGGNPKLAGWDLCYFEGDSQPLGYSWFDETTGAYTEDPQHPVSTPSPGPDPMPLDASTEKTLTIVINALGGTVFG